MACTILLYGATGYSGGLIADELEILRKARRNAYRMVLAGRNADRLKTLADASGMEYSVFGLDDVEQVQRALSRLDVNVVINAAGPFGCTAPCLARAAIAQGCHYADINGEADVYHELGTLNGSALTNNVALVGSAGCWAAASNLLLHNALEELARAPATADCELGAIRIAMSRIQTFSRGSAATVWRSLREQVTVVRKGRASGRDADTLLVWHEPVGKFERSFNFGSPGNADRRIASAASLVDTLAARLTLLRRGRMVRTLASYVEAGLAARVGYQVGAWLAPLAAIPAVRTLAQQPIALLAEGPTRAERGEERHIILLEIDDCVGSTVIDWRWETPNVYQFTAHLVVAVAAQLGAGAGLKGWLTPSEVLGPLHLPLTAHEGPLRGCRLQRRRG